MAGVLRTLRSLLRRGRRRKGVEVGSVKVGVEESSDGKDNGAEKAKIEESSDDMSI